MVPDEKRLMYESEPPQSAEQQRHLAQLQQLFWHLHTCLRDLLPAGHAKTHAEQALQEASLWSKCAIVYHTPAKKEARDGHPDFAGLETVASQ